MKKNENFLILTAALIFSISATTACGSAEKIDEDKTGGTAAQNNSAANGKGKIENKSVENKQIKTIELFDGRAGDVKNTKPSEAETALVEKEVRARAKEEFLKKRLGGLAENVDWEKEFSVDGVAEGAFTKANSKQKAILYRFSYTNGLLILEDGNIVAHYSGSPGDYAFYLAIKTLPDVNQNGLSEIILFRNVEDNDDVSAYFFESKNGEMNFLGEAKYFTSSYIAGGDTNSEKAKQKAYRTTVQPSEKPTFWQETYERTGSKSNWMLTGKAEKFPLDKKTETKLTKIN